MFTLGKKTQTDKRIYCQSNELFDFFNPEKDKDVLTLILKNVDKKAFMSSVYYLKLLTCPGTDKRPC